MLWKGPHKDGITFSLLSKFLVCRHRFFLRVIKGLKEKQEEFPLKLEYGSLWHECEEAFSAGRSWMEACAAYGERLLRTYPAHVPTVTTIIGKVQAQFPHYVSYWEGRDMDQLSRWAIFQEEAFDVELVIPSQRKVRLRGKFDAVDWINKGVWLQENKVKERIDHKGLTQGLWYELQTMIYNLALREGYDTGGYPVKGVRYNVIKYPAQYQGKKETFPEFLKRLNKLIGKSPQDWFFRWKVPIYDHELDKFLTQTLYPVLENLCDWWEWVSADGGENPFRVCPDTGIPGGGYHYQFPFGVYNSLSAGWRGDYWDYLTVDNQASVTHIEELFPELNNA